MLLNSIIDEASTKKVDTFRNRGQKFGQPIILLDFLASKTLVRLKSTFEHS